MNVIDKMFPALKEKGESLSEERGAFERAFQEQFPGPPSPVASSPNYWVSDVFPEDGYIVVNCGNEYYKVSFSGEGDDIEFAPRDEWQEVKQESNWAAVEKAKREKKKESPGEKTPSEGHGGYLVTEPDGSKHLPTRRNGKVDRALAGAAWAALHGGYRGRKYEGPGKQEAIGKLTRLYKSQGWDLPTSTKEASFSITKDAEGKYRWILFSSSTFEDRDREVVSRIAQEKDIARMNRTKEFGYLDWWHVGTPTDDDPEPKYPMLALGPCDFSAMDDEVRVESGSFFDERIGDHLSAHTKELSASLAFVHSKEEPDDDGVFYSAHTLERSVLPKERASNVLADFFTTKEKTMDSDKVAQLKELTGDSELVDNLLAKSKELQREAVNAGIRHKEAARKKKDAEAEDEDGDEGEEEAAGKPTVHLHARKPAGFSVKMDDAEAEGEGARTLYAHAHAVKEDEAESEDEAGGMPIMAHDHTDGHMKEAEAARKETEARVKRFTKEAEAEDEDEAEDAKKEDEAEAEAERKRKARRKESEAEDEAEDAKKEDEAESEAEAARKKKAMRRNAKRKEYGDGDYGALCAKIDALTDLVKLLIQEEEQEESKAKEVRRKTKERIDSLENAVKELTGDLPGGLKTYRPSQSDESRLGTLEAAMFGNLRTKEDMGGDPNDPRFAPLTNWVVSGFKPTQ